MMLVGDYVPESYTVHLKRPERLILANLEGPLLPQTHFYLSDPKAGPSLYSCFLPEKTDNYIFSLANNHIMDYGEPGLVTTINELQQKGTRYCGAGTSLPSARKALIIRHEKITLGIISCCEAQFGVARWHQAGVAEFGPWMYQEIKNLARHVDVVIVSVHAGIEDSPWPSPYIRNLYRSFIDAGATIIHGHHAHVPQGYEEYHNGLILYGMGNFAVDPVKWGSYKNGLWSIGAAIDLKSIPFQWKLITFEIRHNSGSNSISIEESFPEEHERHNKYLELCNRPFHDDLFFDSLWQEVAVRAYFKYGGHYLGLLCYACM